MDKVHGGLEGDNLHAVTLELAVRLHRIIYEHLHNYQFNSAGEFILYYYWLSLALVLYLNKVMGKVHGGLEGDCLHADTLELDV